MQKNRLLLFYSILLLIAVTITYSNHFHNSFHFDDSHTIENNIYIKNIQNSPLFFKDASTFSSLPTNQTYRPLVSTSLAFDYWLTGGLNDTFYFHLSTFILFLLQGTLMFFLYKKIFSGSTDKTISMLSLFGVAWYLLHPVCGETINYIIARSDTLSTLFVIIAFVLYIYSPISRKWHLYLIPIIIGSLAKITTLMFAPLLFVYVLLFEQNAPILFSFKKTYLKSLVISLKVVAPSLLLCMVLFFFVRNMDAKSWVSGGASPYNYLITQPYVILHYFSTFFLPIHLTADTDWTVFDSIWDLRFFTGIFFIAALISIIVFASKKERGRPIAFGLSWFLTALVPTSSIVPFSEVMNDHRLFFPYVGLMIAACWSIYLLIDMLPKKMSYTITAFALIILCANAYGTYHRNKVWTNEETLWYDVTLKSPKNGRAYMNYGLTQMTKRDYTTAEKYFTRTLELWPQYAYGHINMGLLKSTMGRPQEAEKYFKNGVKYGPGFPDSFYYYGRFLKNQGREEEAAQNLQQALSLVPAHLSSRYLLMEILLQQNNFPELKKLAEGTLKITPNDEVSLNYLKVAKQGKPLLTIAIEKAKNDPTPENFIALSLYYYGAGNFNACIEACEKALQLDPNYADAYSTICSAYNELKEWDKAIAACTKALELKPDLFLAKNSLAWAKLNKNRVVPK